MSAYEQVCFFVETHARPLVNLIREHGEEVAIRYLAELHHAPGKHEVLHDPAHQANDVTFEDGGYVLSYDQDGEYVGLEYRLDS